MLLDRLLKLFCVWGIFLHFWGVGSGLFRFTFTLCCFLLLAHPSYLVVHGFTQRSLLCLGGHHSTSWSSCSRCPLLSFQRLAWAAWWKLWLLQSGRDFMVYKLISWEHSENLFAFLMELWCEYDGLTPPRNLICWNQGAALLVLLVDFVDLEPLIIRELSNRILGRWAKQKIIKCNMLERALHADEVPEGSLHPFDLMLL